jgi:hypothetical protein
MWYNQHGAPAKRHSDMTDHQLIDQIDQDFLDDFFDWILTPSHLFQGQAPAVFVGTENFQSAADEWAKRWRGRQLCKAVVRDISGWVCKPQGALEGLIPLDSIQTGDLERIQ